MKTIHLYFILIYLVSLHAYDYDIIIIGAGASGTIAAQTASRYNKRIAVIESGDTTDKRVLSSDIPLKTLIKIAQASHSINKLHELGIEIDNHSKKHPHIFFYIDKVIQHASSIYSSNFSPEQHIDTFNGKAHFVDSHSIKVHNSTITADKFIIATGGEPYIPSLKNIEKTPYLTEKSFFKLKKLPQSIIIVGEGPLGVEMATSLHQLGVDVTLITKHSLILPKYDFELIEKLHKLMKIEGIKIHYNMHIKQLERTEHGVSVRCQNSLNEHHVLKAETLMLALNRSGRTKALNLECIDVKTNADGIIVNEFMQTSVPNIYACGDVVGQMYTLSRVGYYQAQIAAYNACKPFWQKNEAADYSNVSSHIYAYRPLGSIGLTEQESRKKLGKKLHIYHYSYASFVRAHIDNTIEGVAKFICDQSGKLLGAHVLGQAADEIIDSVRIGENFAEQFKDYLFELKTSPNYLDLVWEASKQSRSNSNSSVIHSIIHYIKRIFPIT